MKKENNIQKKRHYILRSLILMFLVSILCLSSFSSRVFDNLSVVNAASASSVTEEELFMLMPTYLNNKAFEDYYGRCEGYCLDAMETVSGTEVLVASYLEGLKSGTKYLVKEGASVLGVTSSNFDSVNKEVAGELLKEYFS